MNKQEYDVTHAELQEMIVKTEEMIRDCAETGSEKDFLAQHLKNLLDVQLVRASAPIAAHPPVSPAWPPLGPITPR
ncbi:MAG: hypothetical protein WC340_10350 [Kiritimatiellia bacterium]